MSDHLAELRQALQDYAPADPAADNGVLKGYVVIGVWSTADGDEWMTLVAGNINDETPPVWDIKGWLTHTLDRADDVWTTRSIDDREDGDD